MQFSARWVEMESILLSEDSQKARNGYRMISLICRSYRYTVKAQQMVKGTRIGKLVCRELNLHPEGRGRGWVGGIFDLLVE